MHLTAFLNSIVFLISLEFRNLANKALPSVLVASLADLCFHYLTFPFLSLPRNTVLFWEVLVAMSSALSF